MNAYLARAALNQYGNAVDAVINVTYQTEPDGDVRADGLAVQFVAAQAPHPAVPASRSAEQRLQELKDLLDQRLINRKEYEQKRQAILNQL